MKYYMGVINVNEIVGVGCRLAMRVEREEINYIIEKNEVVEAFQKMRSDESNWIR